MGMTTIKGRNPSRAFLPSLNRGGPIAPQSLKTRRQGALTAGHIDTRPVDHQGRYRPLSFVSYQGVGSGGALTSSFSRTVRSSYQSALRMPTVAANPRPNIQAKYHIVLSPLSLAQ